ncbi:hypothetical protein [Flavobacterium sp.]|uniref:hypothetical protein n=1 Tax=Flavobacterium sp. TaxID=239 RepID=UPI00334166CA
MCYIESYFISGLIVVMFFEYLFESNDDEELKYSSYGERFLFFLLWPFIVYAFLKGYFKQDDNH